MSEMICQYVVQGHDIKQIEGKMLALVESLGFSEKQEVAVKSLVRQFLWEPFNDPSTPIIWEDQYYELHQFLEKLREERVAKRSSGSEVSEKLSKKSK
jgi:hypothetical protein